MKIKQCLSLILVFVIAMSCIVTSAFPVAAADKDYGTVKTGANGSMFLYFGADSITVKGSKGEMKNDTVNGISLLRPDSVNTDDNGDVVLTLPSVDLTGKDFDKIDLVMSNKNTSNVAVKAGETEIASFTSLTTGDWNDYQTFTANISTKASGNITLNVSNVIGSNTYSGNYVYVKIYKNGVDDEVVPPSATGGDTETGGDDTGAYRAYEDESLSFEERAADLVSRMTTEEKLSQIGYQAAAIDRLGVHSYHYWREALHGVARQKQATSFPTALSMSNTWNKELIQSMATIISDEARGKNNQYDLSYWSPTVNLARDPRWGRNEESFGEDPYLSSQIGAAFVKGMQGTDDVDNGGYLKTIATLKHFAANNNETNRRGGSSKMTEFNLRNYYTRVFQNITEEVMPASVMASYNAITLYRNNNLLYNYKPSAANSYLLQDLLRRNWGFDGYVTSDCGAGDDLVNNNYYKNGLLGNTTSDKGAYLAEAFKSGLNLECYLSGYNASKNDGVEMAEKYLSEGDLDRDVYELFLQRFRTGEFDKDGGKYRQITSSVIETPEHVNKAEEVAEETLVLLENKGMLPLKSDNTGNVVVVGNLASAALLGDYTGEPKNVTYPIDGITQSVKEINPNAKVTHLGAVSNTELLYNIKSITFILKDGKTKNIDLSKAESVSGMKKEGSTLTDVTNGASAVIKSVDFTNLASVKVEMATGDRIGGNLTIAYGSGGPTIASVEAQKTGSLTEFKECEAEASGADGGYDGVKDMYITAGAPGSFSIETNKPELDAADVIIAYAGTIPKQSTYGVSGSQDSSESHDRNNIEIPAHQKHVKEICDKYGSKTVVVMSTVGQMNIESFKDNCAAILWTSYNGQTQGTALGKVLTGKVNPSGRLTTTWYKNDDVAKMELSNNTEQVVEGLKGKYTDYDIQAHGNDPGHTYQYYTGTPVYPFGYGKSYTEFTYSDMTADKTSVDANGDITFSVKVRNSGNVKGKEVVQLYVAHPGAGTGNIPKKQLKGFKKIELEPNQEETVIIKLNVRDMYLFDEAAQKDIVNTGTYTAWIGKNADDTTLSQTFNVTGVLDSKIKTVKAIPTGISVTGYIEENGSNLEANKTVDSNVSVVMTDEKVIDMADSSAVTITYLSKDEDIAKVDSTGKVSAGTKEGVTLIEASATINGETKKTVYPIVNKLLVKPSSEDIQKALDDLKAAYDKIPKGAYSEENLAELNKIYNDGIAEINATKAKENLENTVLQAVNKMSSVVMDKLSNVYGVSSVNPNYIVSGVIDYNENGIGMYDGATGTVTNSTPKGGIMMQVKDENGNVITDGIVWQIKKFDNSIRKVADINSETGELTIYGNGIVQIIAADINNMKCGTLMVQVNMQIEAEYADDGGGADLKDSQSGSSGGFDAGSTGTAWMEYKSVKLSNLDKISVRYAGKNDGTINISLGKSVTSGLIASKTVKGTGGWSTWAETEFELNPDILQEAQLDEYGCTTIYIQANGINLDYFRLNYIENNDDEPYIIEKTVNRSNGKVKAGLRYRGSGLAEDVVMIAAVKGINGKFKNAAIKMIKGTGEYEIETGAAEGDTVKIFVWDSLMNMKPLSKGCSVVWKKPVESEIVVYNLDSKEYDYSKLTGGDDKSGTLLSDVPINGLNGYGKWNVDNNPVSYTYTDKNDNTYDYDFTKAWSAGEGEIRENKTRKRNLFFTPRGIGKVTAVFVAANENGSTTNSCMKIQGGGSPLVIQPGTGNVATASIEITDITEPVYVYGGKNGQKLYAVIVEYYGKEENTAALSTDETTEDDRVVQLAKWGNADVVLTENDITGETKVFTVSGDIRIPLNTDYFYESDIDYTNVSLKMNNLAEYNGRLYAGCDNGLVVVFTECIKCYKLKKICDIDIKSMNINGDTMYVSDGKKNMQINMSDIGGELIEVDEVNTLTSNGGILIDVRSADEFAEKSVSGSVNIPVDNIETGLAAYGKDTALIFYCESGTRSADAVKKAKAIGYTNVYNLGSINKLI